MEMCFHSNQHPWAIKHPFISLYFKHQSIKFICLPVMNSPIFPSLDDIYCTSFRGWFSLQITIVLILMGYNMIGPVTAGCNCKFKSMLDGVRDAETNKQTHSWEFTIFFCTYMPLLSAVFISVYVSFSPRYMNIFESYCCLNYRLLWLACDSVRSSDWSVR